MNSCRLCDLPVGRYPLKRRFDDGEHEFCCLGCMNIYSILVESGIVAEGMDLRDTELFREGLRLGLISNRSERATTPVPPDAETRDAVFHLSGMWCASCGWVIEHALAAEPGVVSAEVSFTSDLLKVKYCPRYIPLSRVPERVAVLGYRASEYTGETERDDSERRDLLLRVGIAGFLWLNVMTLSLVIYAGYWETISDTAHRVVPFVLMALTTPAVFYSAWPILRIAAYGVRRFTLRMEALLALGILSAYSYSAVQAFTGGTHYYFDTACAIITLVLLGKLLERSAKQKTARALALLYRMMPKKARLLHEGRERFVSIDALAAGMVFVVKAGERIPADGMVAVGEAHVDESVLTGESALRSKRRGEAVVCGSLNTDGVLEIRATRVGSESTLTQIIRSVEAAVNRRSEIERTVDRVSRVFVPAVTAVACLTLVGWMWAGLHPATALMRAIAVLVIACPCALGIATPLAITAAIGACSRRGILVSDSRVLELVRKIDVVLFDKTGTVTQGDFSVLEVALCGEPVLRQAQSEAGRELSQEAAALVAALEAYSEHPLGRAVVQYAEAAKVAIPTATDIVIRKGVGVQGRVRGLSIFAGSRRMAAEAGAQLDPEMESRATRWEGQGRTVAFFGWDGAVAGALAFGDRLRPEAAEVVAGLRRRGIRTALISGDSSATTAAVAQEIGVDDYRAEVLPEGKTDVIADYRRRGMVVAMVGDGVNDAPALAAADLGIALGSGTDLAMQAAPVVLMSNDLSRLSTVFEASRDTVRVVRQNLFWAFFYNAAGITLAITGILNPILAAGAMVLSSLSVIGNSKRLDSRIGR